MPEALALVGHGGGRVRLWLEGESFWLRHADSAEVVLVDMLGDLRLQLKGDNRSFVTNGAASAWTEDLLSIGVYNNDAGELFFEPAEGRLMTAEQFETFGVLQTRFSLDFESGLVKAFRCAWRAKPRSGSHVFWDLSSFHSAACLGSFTSYGRWAAHGWSRWRSDITERMGLSPDHMHRAVSTATDDEMQDKYDFRAVSSMALVCLVSRWC